MAALLPLSADEAYYWLWSKHLAAGYFDHPPAIALLIRAGTMLFGDTRLRRARRRHPAVVPGELVCLAARRAAYLEGRSARRAGGAVVQSHLDGRRGDAGGDARHALHRHHRRLSVLPGASARDAATGAGGWGPASAAGLGLLSKYSGLFLGAGAFVWLLVKPATRGRWLKTPWPWAAALLALLIFLPNLWWQSPHHWDDLRLPVRPGRRAAISPCAFCSNSSARNWAWPRRSFLSWVVWALGGPRARRATGFLLAHADLRRRWFIF